MRETESGRAGDRVRVLGIVEWGLGHRTHGLNLMAAADRLPWIDASWHRLELDPTRYSGPFAGLRSNWTVQSGIEARRRIRQARRTGDADAVLVHTFVPAVLSAAEFDRIPAVVSIDATPRQVDEMDGYDHQPGQAEVERLKRRLVMRCFAKSAHVLSASDWAKASLVDAVVVDDKKITTIPFGVDSKLFRCEDREARAESQPVRLLFVGGNFERKGGPALLSVFAELSERHAVELDIVTDRPIDAGPAVRVHTGLQPRSKELVERFHQADIFCLPTTGDCLPLVLAEAAASGLPTVATRVGAIGELVEDERSGLLVDAGNRAQLLDAIERLVIDPALRRRLGERAVQRVEAGSDATRNGERTLRVVAETAGRHRP